MNGEVVVRVKAHSDRVGSVLKDFHLIVPAYSAGLDLNMLDYHMLVAQIPC